jgi:glycerophosphoryl diester phosphodiesterase
MSTFWSETPFTLGHRGVGKSPDSEEPENTLKSFKKAFEIGLHFCECDVRKSKDGNLFVFHDELLERTTNGKGKLINYTENELKEFDAGNGERIPTFEELLKLFKSNVDSRLFVELKEDDCHEELMKLIEKYEMTHQINIISFHIDYLKKIRNLNTEIEIGILMNRLPPNVDEIQSILKEYKFSNLGIGFFSLNSKIFSIFKNTKIWSWNPKTTEEIHESLNCGVIGMGSNDPTFTLKTINMWKTERIKI